MAVYLIGLVITLVFLISKNLGWGGGGDVHLGHSLKDTWYK